MVIFERLQCKRCQWFGHMQCNCYCETKCVACVEAHYSARVAPQSSILRAAAAKTTKFRGCGKQKQGKAAAAAMRALAERGRKVAASLRACLRHSQLHLSVLMKSTNSAMTGTTLSEGSASSELRVLIPQYLILLTGSDGPSSRPPARAVSVRPLVPRARQCRRTQRFRPQNQSPITDVLHRLPTDACVDLTRCFLSTASSLPTRENLP